MKLWELTIAPEGPKDVEMIQVLCICHYRKVWIPKGSPLPYFCPTLKALPPPKEIIEAKFPDPPSKEWDGPLRDIAEAEEDFETLMMQGYTC